ncbi:related to PRY1-strong similarity to the plant PR-1 class of pathogen related proteins [Sporisorium reilianum f. sp. reilianum]|uniref:Related to PRY1-strong similarity to the plant PR-1 class of pathogen related proteins n=1 Tax=Sporisorium reilianum f. sp. reilianum TaxID=72559 RepID=A0A2N8U896_9BASI|nr:related to PRY1-strong similarity to the plant PR-1 class of pathogen related proteins [Sporisorium reilianum f. sp. reilianum]
MKITTTLAAIVGTLAVLAPLSAASQPAVERDSLAAYDAAAADIEARDSAKCGVASRKHHQKQAKKSSKQKSKAQLKQEQEQARITSLAAKKKKKTQQQQVRYRYTTRSSTSSTRRATSTSTKPTSTPASTKAITSASTSAPATSTGTSGGTGTGTLSTFAQTMIDMHNADRAKHSAAALTWDTTLATAAAQWAANCKFAHTPNNPYGQNIAAGTGTSFGAKESCTLWYDEVSQYDYNNPGYSAATGHFTQMVWVGTKKLGCAIQQCTAQQLGFSGFSGNAEFVVCNYDPYGNVQGQFKANVLPN